MQFRFLRALRDGRVMVGLRVPWKPLAWATLAGLLAATGRAQHAERAMLSSWEAEGLKITVDSNPKPAASTAPLGQLPPLLPAPNLARDLRVDMRLDLGAATRINQQHGVEFVAGQPDDAPASIPVDTPPLTRFSGTSLTYQPADAFDITLGGNIHQSIHPSGMIPSAAFTHSLTLGSTPRPETRVEIRMRDEERVQQIGPISETHALGLHLSQRLPGTPLRLTLSPELGTTDTLSPSGTDASDTTRLAGGLTWEITPAASWSLGSQIESNESESQASEKQKVTSGIQYRPNSDFGLAVATEYGETRRHQPGTDAAYTIDPERDLRLRLSPSFSLGEDITARMDIDLGLRDSPSSPDWGQGGGAISFSIGGRF